MTTVKIKHVKKIKVRKNKRVKMYDNIIIMLFYLIFLFWSLYRSKIFSNGINRIFSLFFVKPK